MRINLLLSLVILAFLFTVKPVSSNSDIQIDKVLVEKSKRKLILLQNGRKIREYRISLGGNPAGHKQEQGDRRTPEGEYIIDFRNPRSRFHLSLHISYPNLKDRQRAKISGKNPGGDIFIHGLPNRITDKDIRHYRGDWTDGCIALSNQHIREIWDMVKNNTPIKIIP